MYAYCVATHVNNVTLLYHVSCTSTPIARMMNSNHLAESVEQTGLEPAYFLVANQVFSQLNYCPKYSVNYPRSTPRNNRASYERDSMRPQGGSRTHTPFTAPDSKSGMPTNYIT